MAVSLHSRPLLPLQKIAQTDCKHKTTFYSKHKFLFLFSISKRHSVDYLQKEPVDFCWLTRGAGAACCRACLHWGFWGRRWGRVVQTAACSCGYILTACTFLSSALGSLRGLCPPLCSPPPQSCRETCGESFRVTLVKQDVDKPMKSETQHPSVKKTKKQKKNLRFWKWHMPAVCYIYIICRRVVCQLLISDTHT